MLLLVILFAIVKIAFSSCVLALKSWHGRGKISPIDWNIEKNGKNSFPTGIYLFKINNKNRKILCQICLKLTRKAPGQMRETKFIILTSLQFFNLSFSLLFHVISAAILKFPPWFPASPRWFPTFFVFLPRFPASPRWFSTPAFPSHFSHSHPYSLHFSHSVPQFPILTFTDSLLSSYSLIIYFRKIVGLLQMRTFSFFTTA